MSELLIGLSLAIEINIDPTIGDFGPFTLSWHGLFTALGILAGVTLSVHLARRDGIPSEIGQEIALVGIPCAIVGARLFFVAEHWGDFKDTPGDIIFDITEGGITLYGGLIGGLIGGLAWGLYHRWPIAIALDAAAPGMILGQGIGRIGDLINGEHLAETSGLPWAVEYTHPNTLGDLGVAVHPTAGGYELAGDLIIGALLLFVFRRYLRVPGWTFCSYVIMYGAMRFMFSYTRIDEATIGDIPVPQVVSALTVGLAVIGAGVLAKRPGPITQEYAERAWGDLPEDADANGDEPPAEPAGT